METFYNQQIANHDNLQSNTKFDILEYLWSQIVNINT